MATETPSVSDISTTNTVAVVEPPKTAWEWFKDNIVGVLWIPAGLIATVVLILGYNKLTGRAPVDELPIGVGGNLVIVLAAAAVSIYFFRATFPRIDTTKAGVPWWQVIAIYLIKLFLFWFCWYALSHG